MKPTLRKAAAGALSLCALFALPASTKNLHEPGEDLPDPLGERIEALLDEVAQDAEPEGAQEAAACHMAYAAAYEAAARKSWPRTPTLAPGKCPDRTGKQVRIVCTPAGRWKDLAAKANDSSIYRAELGETDPPVEYHCRPLLDDAPLRTRP